MKIVVLAGLLLAFGAACGSKTVPPGTPAPEYENPPLPPWSPEGADASVAPAPESQAGSSAEESATAPVESPPDAGPEGDGAPADAGAGAADGAW